MERRELGDSFRWLFVKYVPLLYEKRRVARQSQIEMWLDPLPLVKELEVKKVKENKPHLHSVMRYIV